MLPRERVISTLNHEEPDRIPWGEVLIDYNIYAAVLGRKNYVNSHFYQHQAIREGRRDEVVAHYKRDLPDLVMPWALTSRPCRAALFRNAEKQQLRLNR